jgi:hypothetical protein
MTQHLQTKLQLMWQANDEYKARITTRVSDSCYQKGPVRLGLPDGMVGIPEEAYITAEIPHRGEECADVMQDIVQEIDGIHSSGKMGVTVFVVVNGQIAGSASQSFPRAGVHTQSSQRSGAVQSVPGQRGTARMEVRVELDLDDLAVFNLQGDGIRTTSVVSN